MYLGLIILFTGMSATDLNSTHSIKHDVMVTTVSVPEQPTLESNEPVSNNNQTRSLTRINSTNRSLINTVLISNPQQVTDDLKQQIVGKSVAINKFNSDSLLSTGVTDLVNLDQHPESSSSLEFNALDRRHGIQKSRGQSSLPVASHTRSGKINNLHAYDQNTGNQFVDEEVQDEIELDLPDSLGVPDEEEMHRKSELGEPVTPSIWNPLSRRTLESPLPVHKDSNTNDSSRTPVSLTPSVTPDVTSAPPLASASAEPYLLNSIDMSGLIVQGDSVAFVTVENPPKDSQFVSNDLRVRPALDYVNKVKQDSSSHGRNNPVGLLPVGRRQSSSDGIVLPHSDNYSLQDPTLIDSEDDASSVANKDGQQQYDDNYDDEDDENINFSREENIESYYDDDIDSNSTFSDDVIDIGGEELDHRRTTADAKNGTDLWNETRRDAKEYDGGQFICARTKLRFC